MDRILLFNGSSGLDMFGTRGNGTSKIIMNTVICSSFAGIMATFLKPLIEDS
jgi:hypothetical protein